MRDAILRRRGLEMVHVLEVRRHVVGHSDSLGEGKIKKEELRRWNARMKTRGDGVAVRDETTIGWVGVLHGDRGAGGGRGG